MKKIIEISCDEDGETYYVVGDITELGARRAINKFFRECGIEEDMKESPFELVESNFWTTEGGEYDGWTWWSQPDPEKYNFEKVKPLGKGWITNFI